ncbi:MAG: tetratricopeptide (TPR) repeat protein, partial [Planctomycetota bacterium]
PLWSVYGQITQRWLGDETGAQWIHLGQRLAPHHPSTCVVSAAQLLREGKDEQAELLFNRAIDMGARANGILDVLVLDLNRVDFAEGLVGDDLGRMIHFERLLKREPEQEQRLTELQVVILKRVEEACAGPSPTSGMLQRLATQRVSEGRHEEAIRLYRRYLVREPGSGLRFELARALVSAEQLPEAVRELRYLLNVHPGHARARALLTEIEAR